MIQKDRTILNNLEEAIQYEWLETNGLGGWSGSTITGCNTRRYHGLLVAATKPPTERMALVSKLDETLVIDGKRVELGTRQYADNTINPRGYQWMEEFSRDIFPQWTYQAEGVELKKTIAMVYEENTVVIIYDVIHAPGPFEMEFLPLVSARGYHSLQHACNNIWWDVNFENGIFRNQPFEQAPPIYISIPGSAYRHHPQWFYRFNYAVEIYRGQDFEEDLFNHGSFMVGMKEGDSLGIIISTENPEGRDAHQLLARENLRKQTLLLRQPAEATVQTLTLAADQFIVKRGEDLKTVIAGYHWFTDWGRDTMISLPGLCLATGRFEDARKILQEFAGVVSQGMLPNRFQDYGEAPEYNNVDGTLWYFIAVYRYLKFTNDQKFVLKSILPVLSDIISWHHKGTRYHIHDEEDGLLYSGEEGVQLTWMDAKVGDWVVTPRRGKAVEVNALWYNAIRIYAELLELNGQLEEAAQIKGNAEKTRKCFKEKFWNADLGYLYDVIDGDFKDTSIRPNALFAISLPYVLLEEKKAKDILGTVNEKLYTPAGLRSLDPSDPRYVGIYEGDVMHRDSSYHQGTAWTWLLGPYIDGIMKTGGKQALDEARKVVENFKYHLGEGCLGSVSEITDGDSPFHPRGCIAQAWGVGEWLRVILEYGLFETETKTRNPIGEGLITGQVVSRF